MCIKEGGVDDIKGAYPIEKRKLLHSLISRYTLLFVKTEVMSPGLYFLHMHMMNQMVLYETKNIRA